MLQRYLLNVVSCCSSVGNTSILFLLGSTVPSTEQNWLNLMKSQKIKRFTFYENAAEPTPSVSRFWTGCRKKISCVAALVPTKVLPKLLSVNTAAQGRLKIPINPTISQ